MKLLFPWSLLNFFLINILVPLSLQFKLMLKMYKNKTGKKGAMVFLFPEEKPQAESTGFFWDLVKTQPIMFCDAFMPPSNSSLCPSSKTFHLYVLEFTNMDSIYCFTNEQHFSSKGEMRTNMYFTSFLNNITFMTC